MTAVTSTLPTAFAAAFTSWNRREKRAELPIFKPPATGKCMALVTGQVFVRLSCRRRWYSPNGWLNYEFNMNESLQLHDFQLSCHDRLLNNSWHRQLRKVDGCAHTAR